MDSKPISKLLTTFPRSRCTSRPFSTHLPRLRPSSPPSPSAPPQQPSPPFRPSPPTSPSPSAQLKRERFGLAASLANDMSIRRNLDRVSQYDAKQRQIAELEKMGRAKELERQQMRNWKPGDVYAPHDLSGVEMQKWARRRPGGRDVFDVLGIDALGEYKNFSMMSEYMTNMGRIRHRKDTGLRAVNQRKIAKAIRRAVGMGLMPSVHKHPEILEAEKKARIEREYYRNQSGRGRGR